MNWDFSAALRHHEVEFSPLPITTLQLNITKLCNQVCKHCHVDASPTRKEMMSRETIDRCLQLLQDNAGLATVDITGGAPELHPEFCYFVESARALGKHVMVRHNLTVTLDPHPRTGESMAHLPAFFAGNKIEVVSSLPYYQPYFTNKQRGASVFEKSIASLKLLNAVGYGKSRELQINLVYNPVGAYLPAAQAHLERDYKTALAQEHGIIFNNLYTITNMPINRFKSQLERQNAYIDYMDKLVAAFNPTAAGGVMCRSLISVGHDGRLYDCDFNQMLELGVDGTGGMTIFDADFGTLLNRNIRVGSHCFGCTAGAGSSCGGAVA